MSHETDAVVVTCRDAVATIRMNRPETLNAWSKDISEGLTSALREVAQDDGVRRGKVDTRNRQEMTRGSENVQARADRPYPHQL